MVNFDDILSKDEIALLEQENLRGKPVELANYSRIRGMANGMKSGGWMPFAASSASSVAISSSM